METPSVHHGADVRHRRARRSTWARSTRARTACCASCCGSTASASSAADVVIGYLHRGIEKLCENRDWTQIILLTDRMDYVAAASNNLGYCETVEKLMSLEVPRRARYIRTILCRAAADREPLPVARHARDGHRRDDGVPLRVPRARADARSVRGVLRRAADLQLDADRRSAARSCRPAGTTRSASSATSWTRRSTSTKSCSRTTASGWIARRASA